MEINDALIQQWEPKVQKMTANTYILGLDREDLAQELRIAIVKAAQGFEEDRGVLFHTYLHTAMTNTIRTLLSKSQKRTFLGNSQYVYEESLDDMHLDFSSLPMQSKKILEALTDPKDFTIDVEFQEILQECGLDSQEQAFITLRLEGLTMEEITEDLEEPAYKLRQTVREKLLGGPLNEEKSSTWGFDSEEVDTGC
jgi:RNA polymerase sigma factor (sigma-70 family)